GRAAAYFADHGIDRIERVITDNHLSTDALSTSPQLSPSLEPGTSSFAPTALGRTARWRGSTAPCRSSGHTGRCSSATTIAAQHLRPGSSTTTLNAATPHSADSHL